MIKYHRILYMKRTIYLNKAIVPVYFETTVNAFISFYDETPNGHEMLINNALTVLYFNRNSFSSANNLNFSDEFCECGTYS